VPISASFEFGDVINVPPGYLALSAF
jgi:hypothetical protein